SWSWARPFPRTCMLRPSVVILRRERVAVNRSAAGPHGPDPLCSRLQYRPFRWRDSPGEKMRVRSGSKKLACPAEARVERERRLVPRAGFEPATLRLTAGCSAVELPRNIGGEPDAGEAPVDYGVSLRTLRPAAGLLIV